MEPTEYQNFISHYLPGNLHNKLKSIISDKDVMKIATVMTRWEVKLAVHLDLTRSEIDDFNAITDLQLRRRKVLETWKDKNKSYATYGNLLACCLKGEDTPTAKKICEVLVEAQPDLTPVEDTALSADTDQEDLDDEEDDEEEDESDDEDDDEDEDESDDEDDDEDEAEEDEDEAEEDEKDDDLTGCSDENENGFAGQWANQSFPQNYQSPRYGQAWASPTIINNNNNNIAPVAPIKIPGVITTLDEYGGSTYNDIAKATGGTDKQKKLAMKRGLNSGTLSHSKGKFKVNSTQPAKKKRSSNQMTSKKKSKQKSSPKSQKKRQRVNQSSSATRKASAMKPSASKLTAAKKSVAQRAASAGKKRSSLSGKKHASSTPKQPRPAKTSSTTQVKRPASQKSLPRQQKASKPAAPHVKIPAAQTARRPAILPAVSNRLQRQSLPAQRPQMQPSFSAQRYSSLMQRPLIAQYPSFVQRPYMQGQAPSRQIAKRVMGKSNRRRK